MNNTYKFFAFEDSLMLDHAEEGAIEITEQQYNDALAAKINGRKSFVRDGELVIFSGIMVAAWNKSTRQQREFDEFDVIPEDYTTIKPVRDVVWDGSQWVDRIKSPQELAQIEHLWVISELANAQIELMYHWTDDKRSALTLEAWNQYARDLRDYTTTDDNGIPVVVGDERPELTTDEK
jgi:hypothetical protein